MYSFNTLEIKNLPIYKYSFLNKLLLCCHSKVRAKKYIYKYSDDKIKEIINNLFSKYGEIYGIYWGIGNYNDTTLIIFVSYESIIKFNDDLQKNNVKFIFENTELSVNKLELLF